MLEINIKNVSTLIDQFDLGDLTTERAHLKNIGWSDIKIEDSFYLNSINEIVELIGGREKTKKTVRFRLKNEPCHHWCSEHFVWSESRQVWTYVAGQDYDSEIKQIRRHFTK